MGTNYAGSGNSYDGSGVFNIGHNNCIFEMQAESSSDFKERKKEAEMIRKFHPDKIPILLSRVKQSKLKDFDNNK